MRRFMLGILLLGAGAPAAFAAQHPAASAHTRAALEVGGLLPATEKFDRKRLNYASNEARFVQNHPALGRAIAQDMQLRLTSELHAQAVNGMLPTTPYLNYVRWRHSLNPKRFDHYHPGWGPAIERDAALRAAIARQGSPASLTQSSTVAPTSPTTTTPAPTAAEIATSPILSSSPLVTTTTPSTPPGETISNPTTTTTTSPLSPPSAVPEPGGLILLGLGLACGGLGMARRRRRRPSTA